ncbi:MAG: hypothetical protein V4515_02180 [Chloroflexota bacterium]
MDAVVTLVMGRVSPDAQMALIEHYREALGQGLPPDISQTMLIRDGDEIGILSVWPRREDLAAMLAGGEEPFARRLIREAGGTPSARVFDFVVGKRNTAVGVPDPSA